MMTATADALSRLTVFEHPEDGSGKERVSLGANSNLAILVFSKGPYESFFVNDLLGNNPDVFGIIFRLHR